MTQVVHPATAAAALTPVSDRFGRMFPRELGTAAWEDGDINDLAVQMIDLRGNNRDNCGIPSAYTYFGQFVDHDLTLDLVSSFERQIDPLSRRNFRTAALELDTVYGLGRQGSPWLYQGEDSGLLRLGAVAEPLATLEGLPDLLFDLPRFEDHVAVVVDPRNDENVFVSQLQVALCRFHNRIYRELTPSTATRDAAFAEARRQVRLHYQHVVLHDYLPRIVGRQVIADVLHDGRRLYDPRDEAAEAFMPIEFSAAAYRLGHVMVRDQYQINHHPSLFPKEAQGAAGMPAFIRILGPQSSPPLAYRSGAGSQRESLIGGRLRQRDVVDWSFMLGRHGQKSMRIAPLLAAPLGRLPLRTLAGDTGIISLVERNLRRGRALELVEGRVAARHAARMLQRREDEFLLDEASLWPATLQQRLKGYPVPLWYYVLKEAEVRSRGRRLGPLGARIVAETFIGILQKDPHSILTGEAGFQPSSLYCAADNGRFDLRALLLAAGFKA